MTALPPYAATRAGVLGDPGAVGQSASISQLLGAHASALIYSGTQILTANGAGLGGTDPATFFSCHLDGTDYDQPFTMSGTAVGRITVPVLPVGSGADLIVSLCPDASGVPGTPIATTRIAASWITQLAAVAGVAGPSNQLQLITPPSTLLATPQFNALMPSNGFAYTWTPPAPTSAGAISNPVTIAAGNYMVLVGGVAGSSASAAVYTVQWQGVQSLAAAVSQPALPQAVALTTLIANQTTLITAGGTTSATGTPLTSAVYTAGWTPNTGQIAAWSQQASLPQALVAAFGAATANAVYVVGGQNSGPTLLNTVYWATLSNGQISAWNTGPALPLAVKASFVTVIGNYLVVAGGYTNTATTTVTSAVWYAAIAADGSLGQWQTGPSMPYGVANTVTGSLAATANDGFTIVGGTIPSGYSTEIQSLSWGPDGPGVWTLAINAASAETAAFASGPGQWQFFSLFSTFYDAATLYQVPTVSVPMRVSGLTNGGLYHVTLRQAGGSLNNYLRMPLQAGAFPGSPTVLSRASSGGTSWTAGTSGTAIPIGIFDQSAGGQPLHTWLDAGAQHGTLVYATTPDRRLLGLVEHTTMPAPILNVTPTFVAGLGPWTVTGGTGTTSAAQVHGQLPISAQITPSGSAATVGIESEQQPVLQGHSYVASAWAYSAVGYATASVNLRWYNASGFMSATSGSVTALSAGVWTSLSVTGAVPAGALYVTAQVVEGGTPPASAVFWVSAAPLQDTSGPMLASVAQLTYPGAWPGQTWPPTGVVQLT